MHSEKKTNICLNNVTYIDKVRHNLPEKHRGSACYSILKELHKGECAVLFMFMKPYAERFYKSQEWQRCREYVWQRDRGLCVDCIKHGKVTPAEEVHHVIEITPENITDPAITLNPENLVSLCRECHRRRHGTEPEPKRYTVDELGRIVF